MADTDRRYVLISPCRNEAKFIERTLDSVIAQSERPAQWIIVDDGSTDGTADILARYAAQHDWIKVVAKSDRGHRAVGPGVIEAFYVGLAALRLEDYDFLCKLDVDLDLPPRYFEILMDRMQANPRLGSASGKPYYRGKGGAWVSEKCGDEMSVGMTKFYRISCFEDIGGFVSEVMWDGIDCHKARQRGWVVRSWDEPDLQFHHLRPMGSSEHNILTGRARHGFGQHFMGSDPLYFAATALFRMTRPPYVVGGAAMLYGYARAWWTGARQLDDPALRDFIRAYQRQALRQGKSKTIAAIEARQEPQWIVQPQTAAEK
ncbi:glycosyltransferase family 2 protein [Sulfitobacter sp. 1A16787]|uniref:glycosyltransferase family 2 protein n=1 Tax=Sulfitobacter sp. 1A16787 TaxID=3368571 RepID=UPI0037466EBD